MKILVTGGSGFIGRNIRESYLNEKYTIVTPSHRDFELTDQEAVDEHFKRNQYDAVIHGAGKPGHRNAKDPFGILYNNSRMFFNLIRNADSFGKLIIIGSGAAYDMRNYVPKMKEEYFGTYMPADEHGYNKYICGKFIEKSDKVIDLRVFGIFGKYEDYAIRFISNAICKTLFDLPITIKQNRKFDYIYINDLLPVLEYFIENETKYTAYNVTPDESEELLELAKMVREISAKDIPINISQDGMGLEYSGSNARLRDEFTGWKMTPHYDAIRSLYAWYADRRDELDRSLLLVDK
ncbi:MAG: epimerase [Spirochaetae bacterium HGW-Spirochaetae-5]|jgi:GDP-L-fucose synthase|nr:MAG: epimerase [Spirochaetae bacterium HGW-Spirochaetae-5]